jgi:hypothetical protein
MKRQFFLYKLGIVPLITLVCSVNAQTKMFNGNLNTSTSKEVVVNEKASDSEMPAFASNSAMSTKAVKNFNKTFKEARNASWSETLDGLKAEFMNENVTTKVYYDTKGRWMASVRAYDEANLPRDIRHTVKSTYYDYDILHVQEITAGNKTAYLVKIEDETSIKTIRVTDDQMDEYIAFQKSNGTKK